MSTEQSYSVVLRDLEERHHKYEEEITRKIQERDTLAGIIKNLRLFMLSSQQSLPFIHSRPIPDADLGCPPSKDEQAVGIYTNLSTRWAILYLLGEIAPNEVMGRSDIAKMLTDGGITSSAQNFASNVSAVLSGMVNERKEVEQVDGGFRITGHGRDVWEGIKQTPQWRSRNSVAP